MAQKNSTGIIVVVVAVLILIGGGLVYYFSLPPNVSGNAPVAVTKTGAPVAAARPVAAAGPKSVPSLGPISGGSAAVTATDDQQATDNDLSSSDPAIQRKALDQVEQYSVNNTRALSLGLPVWSESLLATKQYEEIARLGLPAILDRSFDPTPVQVAQRLRVVATIQQGKYAEALPLAKSYYNVVILRNSGDAINLLAQILTQTNSPAVAAEFVKQQTTPAPATPAGAVQPSGVLATIKINETEYTSRLGPLENYTTPTNPNYNTEMSAGDLLLLGDHPTEARACFEAACKCSGTKGKSIREALEGVARAVRAQTGSVLAANAYMNSAALNAALVASLAGSPSPSADDLQLAARNTKKSDLSDVIPVSAN